METDTPVVAGTTATGIRTNTSMATKTMNIATAEAKRRGHDGGGEDGRAETAREAAQVQRLQPTLQGREAAEEARGRQPPQGYAALFLRKAVTLTTKCVFGKMALLSIIGSIRAMCYLDERRA